MAPAGDRLRVQVSPWPAAQGSSGNSYDVDAVCVGYGFMPANEILRALGCRHAFDPARGHLVTERDAEGLTSVAQVYAVGDCTGRLIDNASGFDPLTGLPVQSAIPVGLRPVR